MNQPTPPGATTPDHRQESHACCGSPCSPPHPEEGSAAASCCAPTGRGGCAAPTGHDASDPSPAGTRRIRYRIDRMDCPSEERLIRNKLEPMAGIARLDFNLIERELIVFHRLEDPGVIAAALTQIDMGPRLLESEGSSSDMPPILTRRLKALLAIGGAGAVGAELLAWTNGHESSLPVMALAALSIASAGLPTLRKGWIALLNLSLNIYFLMSLAVAGALLIGKWPEAAMVVFLFAVAETIEALSLERARNAIRSLTTLAPEVAEVKVADGWKKQPVAAVAPGSRIRVRTGGRVPLDARVESGRAALDQAPITGESLPVDKQPGDTLYAGSIVTDGVIEASVIATASHSTLARIAAAIQQAQAQRAPTQRFVDRFARY